MEIKTFKEIMESDYKATTFTFVGVIPSTWKDREFEPFTNMNADRDEKEINELLAKYGSCEAVEYIWGEGNLWNPMPNILKPHKSIYIGNISKQLEENYNGDI